MDLAAMLALPECLRGPPRGAAPRQLAVAWCASTATTTRCPPAFAHHDLTVLGGIEQVRIAVGTEPVATHPRLLGHRAGELRPVALPGPVERKPGRSTTPGP